MRFTINNTSLLSSRTEMNQIIKTPSSKPCDETYNLQRKKHTSQLENRIQPQMRLDIKQDCERALVRAHEEPV